MTRRAHAVLAGALFAALGCAPQHGTIGAMLVQNGERRLTVREAPPGLAADKAGVRPGDEILLVDGRDVQGMSADQIHGALHGEVDEPVKLTLVRENRVVRVTLRRTLAPRPRKGSKSAAGGARPEP